MKIGFDFLDQIRNLQIPKTDPTQPRDPEAGPGGGFLAEQFTRVAAQISASWNTEHTDDDKHGNIHCTTISERSRTTPIGEWIDVPFDTANFTASGGMTFVPTTQTTFKYMLLGKTLFFQLLVQGVTVTGGGGNQLIVKIPGGFSVVSNDPGVYWYSDNGTKDIGLWQVSPVAGFTDKIFFFTKTLANWTVSAAASQLWASGSFKVQ